MFDKISFLVYFILTLLAGKISSSNLSRYFNYNDVFVLPTQISLLGLHLNILYFWISILKAIFSCKASLTFHKLTDSLTDSQTFSYLDFYCYLQTSYQKTSFTKCFSFVPRGSKTIFKYWKWNHPNRK